VPQRRGPLRIRHRALEIEKRGELPLGVRESRLPTLADVPHRLARVSVLVGLRQIEADVQEVQRGILELLQVERRPDLAAAAIPAASHLLERRQASVVVHGSLDHVALAHAMTMPGIAVDRATAG
jgi:hypothetical protein